MRVLRGFSCAGAIGWVLPAENKRKTKQGQRPCLSIGMKVSIRILNSFLLCRTGIMRISLRAILFGAFTHPKLANM